MENSISGGELSTTSVKTPNSPEMSQDFMMGRMLGLIEGQGQRMEELCRDVREMREAMGIADRRTAGIDAEVEKLTAEVEESKKSKSAVKLALVGSAFGIAADAVKHLFWPRRAFSKLLSALEVVSCSNRKDVRS